MSFTPGPWRVERATHPRLVEYEDTDGRWRWLAEIHSDADGSDDERDLVADLRLMAEGPAMYKLLQRVAAMHEDTDAPLGIEARALLARIDKEET